jgi:hypothetical protein
MPLSRVIRNVIFMQFRRLSLLPQHILNQALLTNRNGSHCLKVQCHEIVCQLRPLTYSLHLNNAPRISFKLVKSLFKNILQFKQGTSRSKMAGTGFHSIAKLRAQIRNDVLADRGVYSADCHNENGCAADCQSQEYTFESKLPEV